MSPGASPRQVGLNPGGVVISQLFWYGFSMKRLPTPTTSGLWNLSVIDGTIRIEDNYIRDSRSFQQIPLF